MWIDFPGGSFDQLFVFAFFFRQVPIYPFGYSKNTLAVKIKEKVDVDLDLEGKISSKLTETKRLLLSFRKKKTFFYQKKFFGTLSAWQKQN